MSVLVLQREDATPDAGLDLQYQADWSAMRSAHADREVFAYAVISDSGNLYETEVFVSDLDTICGFCNCLGAEMGKSKCRHMKAVLADVIDKNPEFGKSVVEGEDGQENS